MRFDSIDSFLKTAKPVLNQGPVAMVFVEDDTEIGSTLHHHLKCGFKAVLALMPDAFELPDELPDNLYRIGFDCSPPMAVCNAVNQVIRAAPGTWLYYCYNAEYLFFPFCETRSVNEMLTFHGEERRDAMLTYVVDLYAGDLAKFPSAVSLDEAYLDRSGYYAQARKDPTTGQARERQLDFFGGLRWRFEEHVPTERRKIDRIALFRAAPGAELLPNHTFVAQEYNTYACPWHNNLTAVICSFRAAKALKRNPDSTLSINTLRWHNSIPFEWHSGQLLNLGLMETGQWF
ncbi:glycosyltransferase family protein [Pontibaca salina]|uniref:Uncharacterized protein n=1 Tax=Pontibaca salina TaxID=2795731 RepID=A0A934HSH4_9RHOB|nr:hypothetical protein [Pontibaca salina]MBI6630051.1 hypothetical protein [Pontibaca salina]